MRSSKPTHGTLYEAILHNLSSKRVYGIYRGSVFQLPDRTSGAEIETVMEMPLKRFHYVSIGPESNEQGIEERGPSTANVNPSGPM